MTSTLELMELTIDEKLNVLEERVECGLCRIDLALDRLKLNLSEAERRRIALTEKIRYRDAEVKESALTELDRLIDQTQAEGEDMLEVELRYTEDTLLQFMALYATRLN